jgi:hypothetical protein
MTPLQSRLLNMTARDVIGTVIKFRSPKTLRFRTGRIFAISGGGVRVIGRRGVKFFLGWSDLLEVVDMRGAVTA